MFSLITKSIFWVDFGGDSGVYASWMILVLTWIRRLRFVSFCYFLMVSKYFRPYKFLIFSLYLVILWIYECFYQFPIWSLLSTFVANRSSGFYNPVCGFTFLHLNFVVKILIWRFSFFSLCEIWGKYLDIYLQYMLR